MVPADDPFLAYLRSISGRTVHRFAGDGGLDGALSSLALFELCRRFGVECVVHAAEDDVVDALVLLDPGRRPAARGGETRTQALARLLRRNSVVLAPCSLAGFDDIADHLDRDVTLFCRDRASSGMALLQGIDPARVHLCHDLAVHLDAAAVPSPDGPGRGVLTVAAGARAASPAHDAMDLRSVGAGEGWASEGACRGAVRGVAAMIGLYAEVRTDSPAAAILAARLGKAVRLSRDADGINEGVFELSVGPLFADAALVAGDAGGDPGDIGARPEPDDGLGTALRDARRDLELLRQDNDLRLAAALAAGSAADRARAAAILAEETGGDAARRPRLVPIAEVERATRAEQDRGRLAAEEAEEASRVREAEVGALRDSLSAAEQRAAAEAARHLAEVRSLRASVAALELAVASRARTILGLQAALDDREAMRRRAEARGELMRALIDSRSADAEAGRRDADEARRRLDAALASRGWNAFGPLRAVGRRVGLVRGVAR